MSLYPMCRDVQIIAPVIYIKILTKSNKYKLLLKYFMYLGSTIYSVQQSNMGDKVMKYNISEILKREFGE
jgi:hypothetical protein